MSTLTYVESSVTSPPDEVAQIPFTGLDWVWFYVVGTLCNLECTHCLVSAGPDSRVLSPLEVDELEAALQQVTPLQNGRPFQIGFTGGEVFILESSKFHRRLFPMVEIALRYGDLLILTNGLLADDHTLEALLQIERRSCHQISYRVSLDGWSARENDRIRRHRNDRPTFQLILASLRRFVEHGIHPTIGYTYEGSGPASEVLLRKDHLEAKYRRLLRETGLGSLELLGIPFFDQGSETVRRETFAIPHITSPGITNHCIATYANSAFHLFQCSYARSFAKEPGGECGWYKCPILAARQLAEGAFLGRNLQEAVRTIPLDHPQCITCFAAATQGIGMSCGGS
ncbi:MAG: radical SAM protein [bacterium]